MITRLYVDNYKCLVNFEYRPARLQLLYGDNGAGKSTVFEVLSQIRQLVTWGNATEQVFPGNTLTAWQTRSDQVFELDLRGEPGEYRYRVVIEHNRSIGKNRIKSEKLTLDDTKLYEFDGQDAHLYRDDGTAGPVFPFDSSRSGISTVPERPDNQHLFRFKLRLGLVYTLSINPHAMEIGSFGEQTAPNQTLSNFVSWYRHLAQESPEAMAPLFESLKDVIDGFARLTLTSEGETTRVLRVVFSRPDADGKAPVQCPFMLNQISEGQRCLIALYTILQRTSPKPNHAPIPIHIHIISLLINPCFCFVHHSHSPYEQA